MGDEKLSDQVSELGDKEERKGEVVSETEGVPKSAPSSHEGESTLTSRGFSFTRMLRAIIEKDWSHAKYEKKISDTLREDVGFDTKEGGFLVPFNSRTLYQLCENELNDFGKDEEEFQKFMTKSLDSSRQTRATISEGDQVSSIVNPQQSGDFIDLLRNESVMEQAGATSLDLPESGQLDIPKMKNGAIAYWRAENESISESDLSTGDIKLRPNYLGALVKASKESLRHSNPSLENMIRNDMAQTMALKEDETFIYGTSVAESSVADSDVPYGLLDFDVTSKSLGLSSPSDVIDLEANLTQIAPSAWIMNKNERATILKMTDGASNMVFFNSFSGGGSGPDMLMDIPIIVSEQIDDNDLLLGDFSQAIIARDAAMELTTTDQTEKAFTKNQVWFKALLGVDFGVRYDEAFLYNDSS